MSNLAVKLAIRAVRPADLGDGLRAATVLRREARRLETEHVARAVREGWSWSRIASALGVSKQVAHRRHAERVRRAVAVGTAGTSPAVSGLVREAVHLARGEAAALGHASLGPEHLLLGLLSTGRGRGADVLNLLGVTLPNARAEVRRLSDGQSGPATGSSPATDGRAASPRARKTLEYAVREAVRRGDAELALEHVLLAILAGEDRRSVEVLEALDVTREQVEERLAAETS